MEKILKVIKGSLFSQLIISYVFIVSGLIVIFLQCLTLLIWPFDKILYKKANYYLQIIFLSNLSSLAQWWSGSVVELWMNEDDYNYVGKENTICVVNHKYDIDWLIGIVVNQNVGTMGGIKGVIKEPLKYVPLVGWSWVLSENVFVKRNWKFDHTTMLNSLRSTFNYPKNFFYNLIIYCEGTRFTEEKHKRSTEYAKSKGLPVLKHHLLPRTNGFSILLTLAPEKFGAVYDCTIVITKYEDGRVPGIKEIINGEPINAKMFIRRLPVSTIPKNNEQECHEYLYKLYQEKDEIFDVFDKTGDFTSIGKMIKPKRNKHDLYVSIGWLVILLPPTFYYLFMNIIYGSIYFKLAFAIILLIIHLIVKWLTSSMEYKSSYGLKKKT